MARPVQLPARGAAADELRRLAVLDRLLAAARAFRDRRAWNAFALLSYLGAGAAAAAWLRSLRLPLGPALVGGLAFALAPYRSIQTSGGHLLGPIAMLLPLSLWALETRRRWLAAPRSPPCRCPGRCTSRSGRSSSSSSTPSCAGNGWSARSVRRRGPWPGSSSGSRRSAARRARPAARSRRSSSTRPSCSTSSRGTRGTAWRRSSSSAGSSRSPRSRGWCSSRGANAGSPSCSGSACSCRPCSRSARTRRVRAALERRAGPRRHRAYRHGSCRSRASVSLRSSRSPSSACRGATRRSSRSRSSRSTYASTSTARWELTRGTPSTRRSGRRAARAPGLRAGAARGKRLPLLRDAGAARAAAQLLDDGAARGGPRCARIAKRQLDPAELGVRSVVHFGDGRPAEVTSP